MIERRGRRLEERRDGYRRQEHAGAAVDLRVERDRRQHERDGERQETEELAPHTAHAKHHRGDAGAQQRGDEPGRRQSPQEGDAECGREGGRRVDARAEERGVAEAEVAGVPAEDVPARGQRYPEADQVQERLVEGRELQRRHQGQRGRGRQDEAERGREREAAHSSGRSSKIRIRSVNETSGAQPGAVTAIVTASLAAMKTEAASRPKALPSRPMITAAKTTPIQE